jgi:hypothetical protein
MGFDREWEQFRGGPTPANNTRIHVTLNPKGKIYLNKNAYREMGRPEAVTLHYNRLRDRIGIAPANPSLDEAFPVQATGNYFSIYAGPFCLHFGIRLPTTEKFVRPEIGDNGAVSLDLRNTVTVSGKNRKPRSERKGK